MDQTVRSPAPELDLRRGRFRSAELASHHGGHLDIKNPNGYYGASRLYTNNHDRHCDATKDKATEKPNARQVGNGMEGASKTMGTLARNSFHHELRAQKLEWVRGSNTPHGASGMMISCPG